MRAKSNSAQIIPINNTKTILFVENDTLETKPDTFASAKQLPYTVIIFNKHLLTACNAYRLGWQLCGILYMILDRDLIQGLSNETNIETTSILQTTRTCSGYETLNRYIKDKAKQYILRQITKKDLVELTISKIINSSIFIDDDDIFDEFPELIRISRLNGFYSKGVAVIPGCSRVPAKIFDRMQNFDSNLSAADLAYIIERILLEMLTMIDRCEACLDHIGIKSNEFPTITQEFVYYSGRALAALSKINHTSSLFDLVYSLINIMTSFNQDKSNTLTNLYERLEALNQSLVKRNISQIIKLELQC